MGGIFGEGIDLVGERLVGAVIVGVGLPRICLERDLIRGYFDERNLPGFAYAYTYPGMNRVLQAAGRVIRGEADRGLILLVDRRFSQEQYRELFPAHWSRPDRTRGGRPHQAGCRRLLEQDGLRGKAGKPGRAPANFPNQLRLFGVRAGPPGLVWEAQIRQLQLCLEKMADSHHRPVLPVSPLKHQFEQVFLTVLHVATKRI